MEAGHSRLRFGYPVGQARKRERERVDGEIVSLTRNQGGLIPVRYAWLDSPLDQEDLKFSRSDYPFSMSFAKIFPFDGGRPLKKYIEWELRNMKSEAIGVEFGGIGVKAFQGFSDKFFKRSLGVTLADHRDDYERAEQTLLSHTVLEGDILSSVTYERLNEWLGGEKINLIIERMGKGLDALPSDPHTLAKILGIWYELLAKNGIMFVQVPVKCNPTLKTWVKKMKHITEETIVMRHASTERGNKDVGPTSAFFLKKTEQAPEQLPMLTRQELKDAYLGI